MKRVKAFGLIALSVLVLLSLTGCGMSTAYKGVDFSEYIKLGKYKGIKVEKATVKVTDKDVKERINENLKAKEEQVDATEGTVKNGDNINIDYVGKIDGKEFDGGTAEGASLVIGSGQFIDGFESGLIGVKVGETKDLKLKFPSDYSNSKVAGKDVVFTVTVNSKKVTKTPKLDEDFVKDSDTGCKTVAEYKKYIKKQLKKEKTEEAQNTQKDYIWSKVVEGTEVLKDDKGKEKYPEKQIDAVVERYTKMYEDYAKENDLELGDFLEQQMGMTEKEFKKEIKSQAKSVVKEELIIFDIADKEGIEVSKDDYEKFIKETLEEYGYTEESFEEATGKSFEESNGGKENLLTYVYREKVMDFLLDNAKIVDKVKE
ncbi:MAG: trigger factor [Firmicutes bacterium]|nr:trigger factor [Bacillota bacterium]